jgi:dTDP-4-dehydrorhamnose reductase
MPPVVVLGGSGLVGSRLLALWHQTELIAPGHAEVDVLDAAALESFLRDTHAATVVNLAAWADVDGAERESGDTSGVVFRLNVEFPARLAELCRREGKHLIHVSTDYVFDGTRAEAAYREEDATRPLGWYAETKRQGEIGVLEASPEACVARIEMPYTAMPQRKRDLARLVASRLGDGQTVQAVTDQRITPVFLDDCVNALARLSEARFAGLVHVAAADWTTPYDFACGIARRLGLATELVTPARFDEFALTRPARRPQHSWLDVSRFHDAFGSGILRSVSEALDVWTSQWRSSRD